VAAFGPPPNKTKKSGNRWPDPDEALVVPPSKGGTTSDAAGARPKKNFSPENASHCCFLGLSK